MRLSKGRLGLGLVLAFVDGYLIFGPSAGRYEWLLGWALVLVNVLLGYLLGPWMYKRFSE